MIFLLKTDACCNQDKTELHTHTHTHLDKQTEEFFLTI